MDIAASFQKFLAALQANPLDAIWLNPEWLPVWWVPLWEGALSALVLIVLVLAVNSLFPKIGAVARTTAKEGVSQGVFWVLLLIGIFCLAFLFPFLPYNTFGEDTKVYKDSGITLIKVFAIFLALRTASVSISDEIEGRTAVTLLSKPISRWHFIVGKLLGILFPVAVMFIVLGTVFLVFICYKTGFEARENSITNLTDADRLKEMTQILPGLLLSFFEAMILTSVSVAISTRLPMLPNLVICLSIYALGHLSPVVVESSANSSEAVEFVARLIATILPNLDQFSIEAAVTTGKPVPMVYVGGAALYCLLYTVTMTFVALLLFEDRDLA